MNDTSKTPIKNGVPSPHVRAAERLIREALEHLSAVSAEARADQDTNGQVAEAEDALKRAAEQLRPATRCVTLGFSLSSWLSEKTRAQYLARVDHIDALVRRKEHAEAQTVAVALLSELLGIAPGVAVTGWGPAAPDGWTGRIESIHLPAIPRFTLADVHVVIQRTPLHTRLFRLHQLTAPGNSERPLIQTRQEP